MIVRRARKVRLSLEALERRETPSTTHLGGHLAAQATTSAVFRGSGRASVTQISSLTGGGLLVVSSLYGKAAPLGHYTGQLTVIYTDPTHIVGTGYLAKRAGSEIDINISGAFLTPKPKSKLTTGTFTFTVTGGAGAEAGATGSGTMTGTLYLLTGDLGFHLNGKVMTS